MSTQSYLGTHWWVGGAVIGGLGRADFLSGKMTMKKYIYRTEIKPLIL